MTWIGRETGTGSGTDNAYTASEAGPATEGGLEWTEVPVRTLDQVIDQWNPERVALVKVDVEGDEYAVLAGGMRFVATHRPIIYGEFQFTLRPEGPTMVDVGALLQAHDYGLFAFEDRLRLVEVPFSVGRGNVCLIPRERVQATLSACERASARVR